MGAVDGIIADCGYDIVVAIGAVVALGRTRGHGGYGSPGQCSGLCPFGIGCCGYWSVYRLLSRLMSCRDHR